MLVIQKCMIMSMCMLEESDFEVWFVRLIILMVHMYKHFGKNKQVVKKYGFYFIFSFFRLLEFPTHLN